MKETNKILINKEEFDLDRRLLSEIMTDRVDEFSIDYDNRKDFNLFDAGEAQYKLLTKNVNFKGKIIALDPMLFVEYVNVLKEVYTKAGNTVKQEVEATGGSQKNLPEAKNCASIPVFSTIEDIIGRYEDYILNNNIAKRCYGNSPVRTKKDGMGGKTIVYKNDLVGIKRDINFLILSKDKKSDEYKTLKNIYDYLDRVINN